MKLDDVIDVVVRARNLHVKAWEKKSLIPEYMWETGEFFKKTLDEVLLFLSVQQKNEKLQQELEVLGKTKRQEVHALLKDLLDDVSIINNEARYIISRNLSDETSMDKMSAEAIQHYAKKLDEKVKKVQQDIEALK